MKRAFVCLLLSFVYLFTNQATAQAQTHDFFDITSEALHRYAIRDVLDLSVADAKVFGFQVEKHGAHARVGIFDTSLAGWNTTHWYACHHESVATCWAQRPMPALAYNSGPTLYSGNQLLSALGEISETLQKMGVDPANLSLLKVWQFQDLIHLRIGFEAAVVEMNFDCDPTRVAPISSTVLRISSRVSSTERSSGLM